MIHNQFPRGWSQNRVQQVIAYYEEQTEDAAVVEDETTLNSLDQTLMLVPSELVEAVRALIAKSQAS